MPSVSKHEYDFRRGIGAIFSLAWLCSPTAAAQAEMFTIRFEVQEQAAAFRSVKVFEQDEEGMPQPLSEEPVGVFTRVYTIDASRYLDRHTYTIVVNKENEIVWPIPYADIRVTVGVIFRPDDNPTLIVPINIPAKIGTKALRALEPDPNGFEVRKKLIQLGLMHGYFLSTLGPDDGFTKRAAQMWFDSSYRLARDFQRRFFMTEDTRDAALLSLPTNKERFQKSYDEAKSLPILEVSKVDASLLVGNCRVARSLLQDLIRLAQENPDWLTTQRITNDHLTARMSKVDAKCPEPEPPSSPRIGQS